MMELIHFERDAGCRVVSDLTEMHAAINKSISDGSFIWLDVEKPTYEEMEFLEESFNFHPLAIEDCMISIQRPKIDRYMGYLFIVLHAASLAAHKDKATSLEVDFFIGNSYIVTVHMKPIKSIRNMRERCLKNTQIMSLGPGYVFYNLADSLVDNYFPILEKLDKDIERFEKMMVEEHPTEILTRVLALKESVLTLKKFIGPQSEIVNQLARGDFQPIIKNDLSMYFRDISDLLIRVRDTLDSYSEGLSSLLQGYAFAASNRLNEIMKVLTIITTIMMPLTLITGIYGMNFSHMPELDWKFGYFFALLLMFAVGGGMVFYFKHKKWL